MLLDGLDAETSHLVLRGATLARRWGETVERLGYAPRWWDGLGGGCATCSARLARYLQRRGVSASLVMNWGHCFVMVEEWVVDVTFTQFSDVPKEAELLPNIYISKHRTPEHRIKWRRKTVRGLINNLNLQGWPNCANETAGLLGTKTQRRQVRTLDQW